MKRRWPWLALPLLLAAVLVGLFLWRNQPAKVSLAKARIGPAVELVYATGYIEPQQPVEVQARITAPVERVLVEEGQRVTRGQALFVLADDEQQALLAQSAAQRRAADQVEGRTVALFRQGWVTKAARDQAIANADAARAGQATANARRDQLVVRALVDGTVIKRDIEPGELATPSRVLAQLGDPARVRVTATVDERDIARIRVGQQALMSSDAWPGRTIGAVVSEITPTGDPNQRAFRVRLQPAAGANLPLGISLEVNIETGRKDRAVLVPASAVVDGKVWVVEAGRAHRKAVATGVTGTETIEILRGVKDGETVIANPPADLAEGARVRSAD